MGRWDRHARKRIGARIDLVPCRPFVAGNDRFLLPTATSYLGLRTEAPPARSDHPQAL
ncbi:MAG: hypothetical protein WB789_01890 [Thermoplasmata archaeon]